MKSLGLGLLCSLLCKLAWAQELELQAEGIANQLQPLPIFYQTEDFAIATTLKLNWFQAEAACASLGWTLVSLETQAKHNSVYNFMLKSGQLKSINEPVWTSGTNLANTNRWSWFSTGSAFKYRNFPYPPPNSYRCAGLHSVTGYWISEDCGSRRHFVCEPRC
ncbi:lectin subunit alpha-like [Drosophila novamexicana]|uniref:lectin subunit alpha-like n=1 Tax=Drosophila novamexicana TaxID=47314 RepID=UPI0011E5AEF7|nr:lectin subunit alpha-like [Drosophila novamexicana]